MPRPVSPRSPRSRHLETQRAEAHKVIGEHNDFDSVLLTVDVMRRILAAAVKDGDSFRIKHEF
jgi:hypothetical protein